MNKVIFSALLLVGQLVADSTQYVLLTTTHPDKIAVKEIKQVPISGFDSSGHLITLYQAVTTEKFLDLYEAFDIGCHYHNAAMVLAAVAKLEKLGRTVEINDAVVDICDAIRDAAWHKKIGYIASGVIAAFSIVPWLGKTRAYLGYIPNPNGATLQVFEERIATKERVFVSSLILAVSGLVWLFNRNGFRSQLNQEIAVLRVILTSRVCVITDYAKVRQALLEIQNLLPDNMKLHA